MNKYKENQQLAEDFFMKYLYHDGAIATNPGNSQYVEEYATGNQVLSESQGLWMEYCLLKNDQINFDKAVCFVAQKMLLFDFISYRYMMNGELFYVTCTIDDFRIIGALLDAERKWGNPEYKEKAISLSQAMHRSIVQNNAIVDFYDITSSLNGGCFTLCYADFHTMNMLIHLDSRWESIFENSLKITKEGYLGDSFPFFATSFDDASNIYDTQEINTVQSLITAIHLSEINQCPEQTIAFIAEKVKDKSLFGNYSTTGIAIDHINSTAVYALAAILGNKTGNKEMEADAMNVMLSFQVLDEHNELYGGFANIDTKDAYSFDNLTALIAMQMQSNKK